MNIFCCIDMKGLNLSFGLTSGISFENSTGVFGMLFMFQVGLPVGSHGFHCLLFMKAMEHVLSHQRIMSLFVHHVAKSELLFFVKLSLHVVILNLIE